MKATAAEIRARAEAPGGERRQALEKEAAELRSRALSSQAGTHDLLTMALLRLWCYLYYGATYTMVLLTVYHDLLHRTTYCTAQLTI